MKRRSLTILIASVLVACLFCGTVSAQGLFSFINNDSNSNSQKRDIQAAKIENIADNKVTLTLGTLKQPEENSENTNNPSDNFVAGEEKITLTAEDDEIKKDLSNFKAGDIVRVRYNDQNVLQDIDNVNDMRGHGEKRDGKIARIDTIEGDKITLTLGDMNKPEKNQDSNQNTDQNSKPKESTPSDNFVAGDEKVTLTVQDETLKQKLAELKAGDIVFVRYNDQNVLEDISKANEHKMDKDKKGQIARLDSISGDQVTLTLGDMNKPEKNQNLNQNTDQNSNPEESTPADNFVAGDKTVTLTAQDEEVKQDLAELKAGDIVFIRYNDQNVLEDISKADEFKKDGKGQIARVDSINGDQVTLTLGDMNRPEKNQDLNQNTDQNSNPEEFNPADNFVAGDEKVTLTVQDEEVKQDLAELKAGDIVFVRYNDQNVLEDIHNASDMKQDKGGRGRGGHGKSFDPMNENTQRSNVQGENTAPNNSQNTKNADQAA